ncbi:MAG: ABC transporter ATP-binding protein [Caldisericota bacterium]|nr:ABC transporter ATP-binding protein [Caldisericota bacterium]
MKKIDLIGIKKRYPGFSLNVDFDVASGEFISILGPSGSGKTTVLHIIAGFIRQDRGKILKDGIDISFLPTSNRNIGVVFQDYALFPYLSVYSNIAFGLKIKHFESKKIKETIFNIAEQFGITHILNKYPDMISGGEKQRVAVARAMVVKPDVLLMDEPLSSLDAKIRERLMEELKEFHQRFNTTIIYVTHDQAEAMYLAERIVLMNNGRIDQTDTPVNLYEHPKTVFAREFIGKINRLVVNGEIKYIRPEEIVMSRSGKFEGTVEKIVYLDSGVEMYVKMQDNRILVREFLRNVKEIKPGDVIRFDLEGGD